MYSNWNRKTEGTMIDGNKLRTQENTNTGIILEDDGKDGGDLI